MTHGATATWSQQVWASPRPGLSLDELEHRMVELGNTVLARDDERGQLLIGSTVQQVTLPEGMTWQ